MSLIRFQCYVCNQELQVAAEKAGKKAKCIKCETVLTIPAAAAEERGPPPGPAPGGSGPPGPPPARSGPPGPPPSDAIAPDQPPQRLPRPAGDDVMDRERRPGDDYDRPLRDDYDDRPRREERRRDDYDDYDDSPRAGKAKKWKTQWPKVKLGMLLAFIGMCVLAGGFALEHIGVLITTVNSIARSGGIGALGVLATIGNIIFLLGYLAVITGGVFWIFTSNKQGGLTWAIVCLSVAAVAVILFIVFRLVPVIQPTLYPYGILAYIPVRGGPGGVAPFGQPGLGNAIVASLPPVFIATHMMMMGFYVRSIGNSLKDRHLSGRGLQMVITAGVAAGYAFLWPMIGYAFVNNAVGDVTGAIIGIWIFYWGGVVATALLYTGMAISMNLARIVTDI